MTETRRGFRIVSRAARSLHLASCILPLALCLLSCGRSSIANRESKIENPASPRPGLPTTELRIKSAHALAEVATQSLDQAVGLMYRRSMAQDSGMLFAFDDDEVQHFWMKNTLIPLSIAFITRDSLISNILEMAPLDTTTPYVSSKPVRYALEMNAGWFETHGIKPGDTVRGLPRE